MTFFSDNILDNGVEYARANADRLDICSAAPTTYTEATSTFTLGNKTGITMGALQDAAGGGRETQVAAITDGNVTADGTASHYGVTKTPATSELLAENTLTASQAVTNGNTFTLDAIRLVHRDATSF